MTRQLCTLGLGGKKWVAFVFGAAAWAGCFPSLPPESDDASAGPNDGSAENLDDSADGSGDAAESETAVGRACATDQDCNELNTNCGSGVCGADRTCRLITRDGAGCDDGLSCTHSDTCVGATCTGVRYICTAPGPCASSVCDGVGTCNITIVPGACLIDGSCVTDGQTHPSNVCERCNSENPTEWAAFDGRNCDDGNICTTNDICSDRQCIGQGLPDDSAFDWAVRLPDGLNGWLSKLAGVLDNTTIYQGNAEVVGFLRDYPRWRIQDTGLESGDPSERLALLATTDSTVWLASHCNRELISSLSPVIMPTTPSHHAWCLFEVGLDGTMRSSNRIIARPERRLRDGSLLGITDGTLRRFTVGGTVLWERSYGGRLADVAETEDGDLVLALFGDPSLPTDQQQPRYGLFQQTVGTMFIVRLDNAGTARWAQSVYSHPSRDFRADKAHLAVHPSGEITIAGALFAPSAVTLGDGLAPDTYVPGGLFSYDPPDVGSGGDGYVVRYTASGAVRFRRFLTPTGMGAGFRSVFADGNDVLVAGHYDEKALFEGGGNVLVFSDVAGPAGFERPGSMFVRIDDHGNVRWHAGHAGFVKGFARSNTRKTLIAALSVYAGDVGFPPGPVIRDVPGDGIYEIGFNTAGGFECSRRID